jgi:hypothetical protein
MKRTWKENGIHDSNVKLLSVYFLSEGYIAKPQSAGQIRTIKKLKKNKNLVCLGKFVSWETFVENISSRKRDRLIHYIIPPSFVK